MKSLAGLSDSDILKDSINQDLLINSNKISQNNTTSQNMNNSREGILIRTILSNSNFLNQFSFDVNTSDIHNFVSNSLLLLLVEYK